MRFVEGGTMKLTKRQEEVLLSLIRKEIITLELGVAGALEIMACDAYLGELLALRKILKNSK